MRRVEIEVLEEIESGPGTVTLLAERLDKSQGWISEVASDLIGQNLIQKDKEGKLRLTDTYESRLLMELSNKFSLEKLLVGRKEDVLREIATNPKTASEIQKSDYPTSTVYNSLSELQETGAVRKNEDGKYEIVDDTLREFLKVRTKSEPNTYESRTGEEEIRKTKEREEGQPTAFSAFPRYRVDYYPKDEYVYDGTDSLEIEDVLIHAVKFAETKKQTAICAVFHLKHGSTLDNDRLWKKSRDWNCVEKWADVLAYLDQRKVQREELFLPWNEFVDLARDYDVYPRGKHPEESLLEGLEEVGASLEEDVDVYLLGGGNLILRG